MSGIAENKSENIEYLRRSSQMVQSFGPGAMVDFKEQTLMTAAPRFWEDRVFKIYDRRLQKRLGVNYFGLPINKYSGGETKGLSYVRFPEWYYCKVCHKFQSIKDWIKEYRNSSFYQKKISNPDFNDTNMVNHLRCYSNVHKRPADLVCARFVSVCNCGHIDDFPWMEYVHKKAYAKLHNNSIEGFNYTIDQNGYDGNVHHKLTMNALRMTGPEGIQVTCSCGASANMTGVFKEDALEKLKISCTGRHPWKQTKVANCNGKAQAIIRGASSVYFPVSITSIVIPQKAEENYRKVVESDFFKNFNVLVEDRIKNANIQSNVTTSNSESELNNSLQNKNKELAEQLKTLAENKNGLLIAPESLKSLLQGNIEKLENQVQKIKKEIETIETELSAIESTKVKKSDNDSLVMPDISDLISDFSKKIHDASQIPEDEVSDILKEIAFVKPTAEENDFSYKEFEFKALSGETAIKESKYFSRVTNANNPFFRYQNNGIPNFITNVSLIKKLHEVQALLGYSRLKPYAFTDTLLNTKNEDVTNPDRTKMVFVKEYQDKWYPGSEVIGEGIFIEFNYSMISEWAQKTIIQKRVAEIERRYRASLYQNAEKEITPGFILLHTISHLLLNQLSFECGYNVASLKERLYFNDAKKRSGILIYTANGDSEGSLGGLVRQGRFDIFPSIVNKAMESAQYCSNDPVCSCSRGQGKDALNLAACHSCILLPETCCEEFNTFLDRGLLVGTLDSEDFGFLTHCKKYSQNKIIKKVFAKLTIVQIGSDLSDINYSDIWNEVFTEDEGFDEEFKKDVLNSIPEFELKEKPMKEVKLKIATADGSMEQEFNCDIVWTNSKVIYIEACNDNYQKIIDSNTDTGWTFLSGKNLKCIDLLEKLEDK